MAPVCAHPLRYPVAVVQQDQFHLGLFKDDELISELLRRKRINWLTNSQLVAHHILDMTKDRAGLVEHIRGNMAAHIGAKLLEDGYMRFSQEEDSVTCSLRLILRFPAITFTKS